MKFNTELKEMMLHVINSEQTSIQTLNSDIQKECNISLGLIAANVTFLCWVVEKIQREWCSMNTAVVLMVIAIITAIIRAGYNLFGKKVLSRPDFSGSVENIKNREPEFTIEYFYMSLYDGMHSIEDTLNDAKKCKVKNNRISLVSSGIALLILAILYIFGMIPPIKI